MAVQQILEEQKAENSRVFPRACGRLVRSAVTARSQLSESLKRANVTSSLPRDELIRTVAQLEAQLAAVSQRRAEAFSGAMGAAAPRQLAALLIGTRSLAQPRASC